MADPADTAPQTATAQDTSTPNPPPAPIAPAATDSTTGENANPPWLKARLDREREAAQKALLRDLGVDDPKAARDALAAYKAAQDAAKTEAQRLADEVNALRPKAERLSTLESVINARAESELASLSETQRAAVVALAGDDSAARLRAIDALRPTWAAQPATTAVAPKPLAAPASTTASAAAPRPGEPTQTDHKAVYAELRKSNPMAAASYALAHQRDIYGGA